MTDAAEIKRGGTTSFAVATFYVVTPCGDKFRVDVVHVEGFPHKGLQRCQRSPISFRRSSAHLRDLAVGIVEEIQRETVFGLLPGEDGVPQLRSRQVIGRDRGANLPHPFEVPHDGIEDGGILDLLLVTGELLVGGVDARRVSDGLPPVYHPHLDVVGAVTPPVRRDLVRKSGHFVFVFVLLLCDICSAKIII